MNYNPHTRTVENIMTKKKANEADHSMVIATPKESVEIGRLKKLMQQRAVIELAYEQQRQLVTNILVSRNTMAIDSKQHGTLELKTQNRFSQAEQTKRLVNGGWVKAEVLAAVNEQSYVTTEPYLSAPREWTAEVRAAAKKAA